MSGLLPERQYKQLMAQYDSEQAELESQMETMKSEIAEDKSSSTDIRHFISLIRKCKNPTEISDSMFNELVDKIVVYEAEGAGNARTQKVDIYFNYVGQVDIAYTEEELAELKAQKEQEERQRMEKQRKREKAYREKRKAKKIAKNGGEIIKTKTCPHCGKVFTPTSNRQLFCSRECWNQARLEQMDAGLALDSSNLDSAVQATLMESINDSLRDVENKAYDVSKDANQNLQSLEQIRQNVDDEITDSQKAKKKLDQTKKLLDTLGVGKSLEKGVNKLDDHLQEATGLKGEVISAMQDLEKVYRQLDQI